MTLSFGSDESCYGVLLQSLFGIAYTFEFIFGTTICDIIKNTGYILILKEVYGLMKIIRALIGFQMKLTVVITPLILG